RLAGGVPVSSATLTATSLRAMPVVGQPRARPSDDRFDLAPYSSAAGELLVAGHQRCVEPFRQRDVGGVIDGEIVPKSPEPAAQRRDVFTPHWQQLEISDAFLDVTVIEAVVLAGQPPQCSQDLIVKDRRRVKRVFSAQPGADAPAARVIEREERDNG